MRALYTLAKTAVPILLGAGLLAGCDDAAKPPPTPKAKKITLNVRTVDKAGKPVEMVRFYINSKKFGITDQDGSFKGSFPAKDGDLLRFNVEAPTGYSVPPDVDQSQWNYEVRYPADGRSLQVDFTATLQRPQRQYLFMVRSKTPATPLSIAGSSIVVSPPAKTGPTGEALIFVKGVPGTTFAARAGSVKLNGTFSEDDAVYLMTPEKQGQIGGDPGDGAVAAAPAQPAPDQPPSAQPPSAQPPSVAIAPPPSEPAMPVPASGAPKQPATVAVAPPKQPATDDIFAGVGSPSAARVEKRDPPPRDPPPRRNPRPRDPPPVAVAEPDPQPVPQPAPQPVPQPAPQPEVVVAANPEPAGEKDPVDILLDPEPKAPDTPPPAAEPEAPVSLAATPPARREDSARERYEKKGRLDTGLIDEDGATVKPGAINRSAAVTATGAGGVSSMSRQEVDAELKRIKSSLASSQMLTRKDVDFLGQVSRSQPGYAEANRLLADYYYRIKNYKLQASSLENATKRGRYKHDPSILLSLAKAYGKRKNYGKALRTMGRVDRKMRRLPAGKKADAYRFHAELLEFEFDRQYGKDQKAANTLLLDRAIQKWEKFQTFARGADSAGVAKAKRKIKELKERKQQVEL